MREHDYDKIYQEAIQVAAMARKIALCTLFGTHVQFKLSIIYEW